ncbi:MAG: LCP family protein [Bacillota bacterium]
MAPLEDGGIGPECGGPIGPSPFEPAEKPRYFTFWRVVFLAVICLAALIITLYVSVSSWLSPEATFAVYDRPINVLILGIDRTYDYDGEPMEGPARADVIMLASFNPRSNTTYLISIPRDTRARIPGHGINKINASHTYGGQDLTRMTVQDLLSVPIDRYAEVDFQAFVRIIDAIGGVEIDVDKDMQYEDRAGHFKVDIQKGKQVLDGTKALGYVRYRADALGDISRVRRQQILLKGLAQQAIRLDNLHNLPEIVGLLKEYVKTDMSQRDMASIGWFLIRTRGRLVSETLPGQFSRLYWIPDGKAIGELIKSIWAGFGE